VDLSWYLGMTSTTTIVVPFTSKIESDNRFHLLQ
jgi:hypothetical protein